MPRISRFTPRRRIPGKDAGLLRAASGGFGKRARIVPTTLGEAMEAAAPRWRTRRWRGPSATVRGIAFGIVVVVGALAWEPVSLWAFGSIRRRCRGRP